MVRLYLPTFIFDVVHQPSQHLFFDYFLKALTLFVKKTLQALCFVVVVKLKMHYKMIASVVSCQLVRDWTASRDALIRTLLSAFCLALWQTESKTCVRIFFHRHGKAINLVHSKFEFAFDFHSARSVASKRRIILLLTCVVRVSYQRYKASTKEMILKKLQGN